MRNTVKRAITVAALGAPLLLGAPTMALASDGGDGKSQPLQEQEQGSKIGQGNTNKPEYTQVNVNGEGNKNSASNESKQDNNAKTGQTQGDQKLEKGGKDKKGQ